MFTGIVQCKGCIESIGRVADGWSLTIQILSDNEWEPSIEIGESVAVQGVCLTVTSYGNAIFSADLLDETMSKSALSFLSRGSSVNLERALALGDRLGGHIVTGHVDEVGTITAIDNRGRDYLLRIGCSDHLARHSVLKGSITIDGISLTISGLGDDWLEVNVIPHTWSFTTLSERNVGDPVNLEGDIIGKYIARLMGISPSGGVTEELLRENGFV